MRVVLVVTIEIADTNVMARVVGAIRESVATLAEGSDAGVSMTAHVREDADQVLAAVKAIMDARG